MLRTLVTLTAVVLFGPFLSLQAQQTSCSNSSLNGTYYYVLSGTIAAGASSEAYAELGKLVADGKDGVPTVVGS